MAEAVAPVDSPRRADRDPPRRNRALLCARSRKLLPDRRKHVRDRGQRAGDLRQARVERREIDFAKRGLLFFRGKRRRERGKRRQRRGKISGGWTEVELEIVSRGRLRRSDFRMGEIEVERHLRRFCFRGRKRSRDSGKIDFTKRGRGGSRRGRRCGRRRSRGRRRRSCARARGGKIEITEVTERGGQRRLFVARGGKIEISKSRRVERGCLRRASWRRSCRCGCGRGRGLRGDRARRRRSRRHCTRSRRSGSGRGPACRRKIHARDG